MTVLSPVVDPAAISFVAGYTQFAKCSPVGFELVGDDGFRLAKSAQQFSQQFQCGPLVAPFRHDRLENLAFMINSTPQVVDLAVNLHVHLVEMPFVV